MGSPPSLCPACHAARVTPLFTARDLHAQTPGRYTLARCETCSLIYVQNPPAPEQMGAWYHGEYWSKLEEVEPVPRGVRILARRIVARHPRGRAIDVGCGAGRNTAYLRDCGLDVVGLDPYAAACRQARERQGVRTVCALLPNAPLPEGTFDAITFLDVLEHLHDPLGDLRHARSLLRPGGGVYIKLPNVASVQARLFRECWAHVGVPWHLNHFTPRALRNLLVAAGFERVTCWSPADPRAAYSFELSLVLWLRERALSARDGAPSDPSGPDDAKAVPEAVYPAVPRLGKRAFRWCVRHLLYAPIAVENLIGLSPTLLAVGLKA